MQRNVPVPARGEQRIGEAWPSRTIKKRGGQPRRLVAVQEEADLALIADPPDVAGRRTGSRVANDQSGVDLGEVIARPTSGGREAACTPTGSLVA